MRCCKNKKDSSNRRENAAIESKGGMKGGKWSQGEERESVEVIPEIQGFVHSIMDAWTGVWTEVKGRMNVG